MYQIKQLGIALAASAVVMAPVFAALWKWKVLSGRAAVRGVVFSAYLSVVFTLVGMPSLSYWQYLGFYPNLNWIPLVGIPADFKNAVLNVLLFVPLGILLPSFWKKYESALSTFGFGLGLSLFIEVMQMFTYRATDVDDLITNTLGTLLGYGIVRMLCKFGVRTVPDSQCIAFPLLGVTCLAMFLIQPYLTSRLEILLL